MVIVRAQWTADAGSDDAGFRADAGLPLGVHADDDAPQRRHVRLADAIALDQVTGPVSADHVGQQLATEFLPAQIRALVATDDLLKEGGREVRPVLVGGAARDDGGRVRDQISQRLEPPRAGCG